MSERLASERVVISAPMSYHGSAARIWQMLSVAVLQWTLGLALIAFAWTVITGWYLAFGLLLVPYRLIRRGGRKQKAAQLRHREMLEAVEAAELRRFDAQLAAAQREIARRP